MWEGLAISVVALISVLIGYGMGKENSKPSQYIQNIYSPETIDPVETYQQTKNLLKQSEEDA